MHFFAGLNVVVLLVALPVGFALNQMAQEYVGREAFFIEPAISGQQYFFTPDELDELTVAYPPLKLYYTNMSSGLVSSNITKIHTKIIYTSNMERGNNIIINDSLAWQLFGSLDVVNKSVYVDEEIHTVVRVEQQKRVTKDGCCAYLPLNLMPGEREISGVFLQPENYTPLGYLSINAWLNTIGKDARDYNVTDNVQIFVKLNTYSKITFICSGLALLNLIIAYFIKGEFVHGRYKSEEYQ